MTNAQFILDKLTNEYPELSPRLQQVANHIVNTPEDVALCTMRGLASDVGVPASTMVRLAQAMGFENYESFRKPFEQAMRQRGEAFSERAQWLQHLAGKNQTNQIISAVAKTAMSNLETAFARINPEDIEKAAEIIGNARRIYVTGVGAMQYTSGFFYSITRMALANIVYADPVGGGNFDDLSGMGDRDVLFFTAFEPCATASVRTVEFALSRNAKIVVLTDSLVSPVARGSAVTLVVPTDSPQFFPSQSAVMAVLEALVAVIVAHGGQDTISRIEQIVKYRTDEGLYWRSRSLK